MMLLYNCQDRSLKLNGLDQGLLRDNTFMALYHFQGNNCHVREPSNCTAWLFKRSIALHVLVIFKEVILGFKA